jgi:hypothetical protein
MHEGLGRSQYQHSRHAGISFVDGLANRRCRSAWVHHGAHNDGAARPGSQIEVSRAGLSLGG